MKWDGDKTRAFVEYLIHRKLIVLKSVGRQPSPPQ
jgi:hypothetical protein